MLLKLKRVTCRTSGTKSVKIRAFTVSSGALACAAYALKSAGCTRPAICCLATTSPRSLTPSSGRCFPASQKESQVEEPQGFGRCCKHNPDSKDIFQDNLLDNYYPRGPSDLEGVRLYDFVANYDYSGTDGSANRKYRKLTKPRLPNHKLFDPEREDQTEAYYYSLILLFVAFRDERSLLLENETAKEAFRRLLPDGSTCSTYHSRLQKMLQARANIKQINDARQADGEEHKISKQDGDPQLLGEAKTAMKELFDMNAHPHDKT